MAPNLVSIDGEHSPRLFVEEMVPWMMQSPIMPKIALLSSATTQSLLRGPDLGLDAELMSLKSAVLTRVNEFLRDDFTRVASEVLRSVIHLVIMEVRWRSTKSRIGCGSMRSNRESSGSGARIAACGLISGASER